MIAAFITLLAVGAFAFGIAMLIEKRSDRKKAEAKAAELLQEETEDIPAPVKKAKKTTKKSK